MRPRILRILRIVRRLPGRFWDLLAWLLLRHRRQLQHGPTVAQVTDLNAARLRRENGSQP